MPEEEKALMRFAKERQRHHERAAMFNLEDGDMEQEELTHLGRRLGEVKDDYGAEEEGACECVCVYACVCEAAPV